MTDIGITPGALVQAAVATATDRVYRNGVEMEKGFILTQEYIEKNRKHIEEIMNIYSVYPDLFLDTISLMGDKFTLFFYQRIFIRASMRYRYHYCVATRAFSKTFVSILALILKCIFLPRTHAFIVAPAKSQAAKNSKDKIIEIFQHWPLLKKEIVGGDNERGKFWTV